MRSRLKSRLTYKHAPPAALPFGLHNHGTIRCRKCIRSDGHCAHPRPCPWNAALGCLRGRSCRTDGALLGLRETDNDLLPFLASSASALLLVVLFAASMFPTLVVATTGTSITIANAASSDLALAWMTGITCIGLPLVLVYHVLVYRTFRGRISADEANEY